MKYFQKYAYNAPKRHLHGHFPRVFGRYFLMHGTAVLNTPENKKTAQPAM